MRRVLSPLVLGLILAAGCPDNTKPVETGDDIPLDGDADGDGFSDADDCDDVDAHINPGATETCDGVDNNCDGAIDEDLTLPYYADLDDDGFGDPNSIGEFCARPEGYVPSGTDCDDTDPGAFPGNPETCDGVDNNCDTQVDEGLLYPFYADLDADSFGNPDSSVLACAQPKGYVEDFADCDDLSASNHPGGVEVCDETDNDCDNAVDEGVTTIFYEDLDGDGFGTDQGTSQACSTPVGYADTNDDCDDGDAAINPGSSEICDDIDNDCDGNADEADATDIVTWYRDFDGDSYGDPAVWVISCDSPKGYVIDSSDCNDASVDANPTVLEFCDGLDNDCDALTDESDALDATTWYADLDDDGYGNPASQVHACEPPQGTPYVVDATDCDDTHAEANPGAPELCDGLDNDCDRVTDEDDALDVVSWYIDRDGDAHGDPMVVHEACNAPSGYVGLNDDCDDATADAHPGQDERCDSIDNDCDGQIDEADAVDAQTWYRDADLDTWGDSYLGEPACNAPSGYISRSGDCDDANVAVHPQATEVCDDVDQDCDGLVDEGLTRYLSYQDLDADTFGNPTVTVTDCSVPTGFVSNDDDCADSDAAIHPGVTEICDGVDQDCDGTIDDGVVMYTWYRDLDGDSFGQTTAFLAACSQPTGYAGSSDDCNDAAPNIYPGAAESCDGLDNDCDTLIDEGVTPTWYWDADADSYGDPATAVSACSAPLGYIADHGDCNDADASIRPGATEVCDYVDNDCDGTIDNGVQTLWYRDGDADGFGAINNSTQACTQPAGYLATWGDCDDTNANANPAAIEVCDGADNDCDTLVDEGFPTSVWYADTDGDTYGDISVTTNRCYQPAGYVANSTDCDDTRSTVYPDSPTPDIPGDGIDQNCDGSDSCPDLDCDGIADIVLAGFRSGTTGLYTASTFIYYGTGTGFDNTNRDEIVAYGVRDAMVQDIDEDGYQDILLLNNYNGTLYTIDSYILWGSAAGYSTADKTNLATTGAWHAAIDDLDEDGFLDIVIANYYTSSSAVATSSFVYWGSASGYSTADRTTLAVNAARKTLIADFDDDGWKDIVFASYYTGSSYSSTSYVYWGSAAGYSSADRTAIGTIGATDVETADVDRDGHLDLVFAGYTTGASNTTTAYVYFGSSSGFSSARRLGLTSVGALDVEISDLNHDTWLDLVFANYVSGSSYSINSYVYWGSSTGYSTAGTARLSLPTIGTYDVEVSDLDNDGWEDLTFSNYYSGSTYHNYSYVYWGSATGYTTVDRTGLYTYGATKSTAADVDGDGWKDVFFGNYFDGSTYSVDSYLFWGSPTGYVSTDREDIAGQGVFARPIIVGD